MAAAVAGVATTVLVIGGLGVLGLPLLPRDPEPATSVEEAPTVPTAPISTSPAAAVLDQVLARRAAPGYRGEAAWTATPSAPLARWCPAGASETAPLTRTRVYRVSGAGPAAVTVSAYGAGQGVGAVAAFGERMRSCRSATFRAAAYGVESGLGSSDTGAGTPGDEATAGPPTSEPATSSDGSGDPATGTDGGDPATGTDGGDADAVIGWVTPVSGGASASVLVWRRGDLVISVLTAGAATGSLAATGKVFDARAVEALAPVCAFSSPSLDDVARSPWQSGFYAGNQQPRAAPLTYPPTVASPTPSYPRGVTPVPVPQETPSLPALPTVMPTALPATVIAAPSPSPPPAPSPVPSSVIVGEQVADPIGPGCGWAFTSQGVPGFDGGPAAASFAQRFRDAQASLREQDLAWQAAKVRYAQEWALYIEQAEAFSAYARAVSAELVREQDAEYVAALQEWQLATFAREDFLAERGAAQVAYEEALARCALVGVPAPSLGATASPVPSPTSTDGQPAPVPSATPSGLLDCPPTRPVILDAPVPTVPPSPEPPRG